MPKWQNAELVDVEAGALAADMHGMGVMLIVGENEFHLSWSLRIGGKATLPDVEQIAEEVSAAMRAALEVYDMTWTPDD